MTPNRQIGSKEHLSSESIVNLKKVIRGQKDPRRNLFELSTNNQERSNFFNAEGQANPTKITTQVFTLLDTVNSEQESAHVPLTDRERPDAFKEIL